MDLQKKYNERVSLLHGRSPIVLICPHGYQGDDKNTALITELIAKKINCYAVINRGWERSEVVDTTLDRADCNNVYHCHEEVVKEEFLDPILRFCSRALRRHPFIYTFYLHGMSNNHRLKSGIFDLDLVVGCGGDDPNNFSCSVWRKNLVCFCLSQSGLTIAEGSRRSNMAASTKQNMNQLFVQWYSNALVQSMQLEIVEERRKNIETATKTAEILSNSFSKILDTNSFYSTSSFYVY